MSKKRILIITMIMIVVAISFSSCGKDSETISSIDELNSSEYTLALDTGCAAAIYAEEIYDKANLTYTSTAVDAYLQVKEKKADATAYSKELAEYAINYKGLDGLTVMDGVIGETDVAIGISKEKADTLDQVNEFIAQLKEDGTLNEMYARWFGSEEATMPDIPKATNPQGTLKFGTSGDVPPMTFYGEDGELTGFDVELMKRLALYFNMDYTIETMTFTALDASLESSKIDYCASDFNATEERKETITMSDAYRKDKLGIIVRSESVAEEEAITSLEQLDGKRIGIDTDALYAWELEEQFPNANIVFFEDITDLNQALQSHQIDAYTYDVNVEEEVAESTTGTRILDGHVSVDHCVFMLAKENTELRDKINKVIAKYKKDGTITKLEKKWLDGEGPESIELEDKDTPNGELRVGVVSDKIPISYMNDGEYVGYDVELIARIAQELGYEPVFTNYSFSGLITSINNGKEDVIVGALALSDGRSEEMACTDTVYISNICAVVNQATSREENKLAAIKESFYKTFIKDSRWKMIASGLLVTIEISLLAIILGSIFGFLFSFALRSENRIVRSICNALSNILDGLPMLITLMIFYYVVFASVQGSAMFVAVFAFTMYFTNTVACTLNTGVGAVDKGQIEAASAMGYTPWQTFKKIIFPQAINYVFGTYSGAVISLIKGTSIVGFITVQDLTRATDIIRSHTYEAFFPLIVSAIIYFIIARVFIFLLEKQAKRIDPKARKRVIEGVKSDD